MSRKKRRERRNDYGLPPAGPQQPAAAPGATVRTWVPVVIVLAAAALAVGLLLVLPALRGGARDPVSDPNNPVVTIDTSHGTIVAELFLQDAPVTVKNFLQYVDEKHYDGTIFHRVIPNFMIQGGGFTEDLRRGKPDRAPIENESANGLQNKRGTLAMARTNDPNSATDQFFINHKDNSFLDRAKARDRVGYAVFGKVIQGMDVVDRIAEVPTGERGGMEDVPINTVLIKSVRRGAPE